MLKPNYISMQAFYGKNMFSIGPIHFSILRIDH